MSGERNENGKGYHQLAAQYLAPQGWAHDAAETKALQMGRYRRAQRALGMTVYANRQIRRWRLDNPYSSLWAWHVLLREAKEYNATQRYGRRGKIGPRRVLAKAGGRPRKAKVAA